MDTNRRSLLNGLGSLTATALLARPGRAAASPLFTPEMFGAKGDGVTNDSKAMKALAAAVNAKGGGVIVFRPRTYLVGEQSPASDPDAFYSFDPVPLLEFKGCRAPLVIRGNGARLKCADGLRFGVFTRDGQPLKHPMPYVGPGGATPYQRMVGIENCTGPVEVSDLELDGNVDRLVIGGQYGDTGWQISATGLVLRDNRGDEIVRNVHTHHHALDGLVVNGVNRAPGERPVQRRIIGLRAEHNGRQGCSIVGGHGYSFERCRFNRTGRAQVMSNPGAGLDIEAEGEKKNRDLSFADCEFSDNAGCGMVADTGDSEGASFVRCTFVGTTNWAAWPCKPRFSFRACTFVGPLVRAFGDDDPARAAQFFDCTMTDDPALSPTGQVYGGANPDRPLADLSDARNMLFRRCAFLATHAAVLPWSTGAIYADCRMEQSSPKFSFPRGTYLGRTIINGNVNLAYSKIVGEVILNGTRLAAGKA